MSTFARCSGDSVLHLHSTPAAGFYAACYSCCQLCCVVCYAPGCDCTAHSMIVVHCDRCNGCVSLSLSAQAAQQRHCSTVHCSCVLLSPLLLLHALITLLTMTHPSHSCSQAVQHSTARHAQSRRQRADRMLSAGKLDAACALHLHVIHQQIANTRCEGNRKTRYRPLPGARRPFCMPVSAAVGSNIKVAHLACLHCMCAL